MTKWAKLNTNSDEDFLRVKSILDYDPTDMTWADGSQFVEIPADLESEINCDIYMCEDPSDGSTIRPINVEMYVKTIKGQLAFQRWLYETAPLVLADDKEVSGSRESVASILNALSAFNNNMITSSNWKCVDGSWITLDQAGVEALAQSAVDRSKKAFDAEKSVHDWINSNINSIDDCKGFNAEEAYNNAWNNNPIV